VTALTRRWSCWTSSCGALCAGVCVAVMWSE
jgi:hypothetical protein